MLNIKINIHNIRQDMDLFIEGNGVDEVFKAYDEFRSNIRHDANNNEIYKSGLFNTHACHCLVRNGIKTLDELIKYNHAEIFNMRHVGKATLEHIEKQLSTIGLSLSKG